MIWDGFGHSKYLVIWAFGQKNELWQAPTVLGQKLGKMRFPGNCKIKKVKKAIVREEILP
jgi:hypothetical protein